MTKQLSREEIEKMIEEWHFKFDLGEELNAFRKKVLKLLYCPNEDLMPMFDNDYVLVKKEDK